MAAPAERIPPALEHFDPDHPLFSALPRAAAISPASGRVVFTAPAEWGDRSSEAVWELDASTGDRRVLIAPRALRSAMRRGLRPVSELKWLPGGDTLLLSAGSTLLRWDAATGLHPLTTGVDAEVSPSLSPDAEWVAFVRNRSLWVVPTSGGRPRQLCRESSRSVLSGKLDWVTWEELGHRSHHGAVAWAPDSDAVAYLRTDQSAEPRRMLRSPDGDTAAQAYPRPGDNHGAYSVRVVDIQGNLLAEHRLEPETWEFVAPTLAWSTALDAVLFVRLTRDQRRLELVALPRRGGTVRVLFTERDPHWLNQLGPAICIPGTGELLWISERTGRAHLHAFHLQSETWRQLTDGDWQVESLHGLDSGMCWITGTGLDPRDRHVYVVDAATGGQRSVTPTPGVWDGVGHPTSGRLLVRGSTPDRPPCLLLCQQENAPTTVAETTAGTNSYAWAERALHQVSTPEGDILLGQLLTPPNFDATRRYPVVVHVYGGPHAQTVRNGWQGTQALDQLLVAAGILVWKLDNRGSWGRGHAFEEAVAGRFGAVELADQLLGVAHLGSLPYVDPSRIGITGWSFGGFLTLYAMLNAPDVWTCGVAGAPVTDWSLYDSIYTERYLGLPGENQAGYRDSSPVHAAAGLGAPLLLVHGAADDNVHLEHTYRLIDALARERKQYELIIQPGEKHGFRSSAAVLYTLDRTVTFFREHLQAPRET